MQSIRVPRYKNDARVKVDETLDLSPHTGGDWEESTSTSIRGEPDLYRLVAVVTHAGGANGGHYMCYRRRGDGWVFASDEHVMPVSFSSVQFAAGVYLAFYEQVVMQP